jgi:ATP-dependent DNA helicase DinG
MKYLQHLPQVINTSYWRHLPGDIERWIDFLVDLESKMLDLTGNSSMAQSLSLFRKTKFNWISKKKTSSLSKKKIVTASEIFESDEEIAEKYE